MKTAAKPTHLLLGLITLFSATHHASAQEQGHGGGECDRRIKQVAGNLRDDWIKRGGTKQLKFQVGMHAALFDEKALAVLDPLLDKKDGAVKIDCVDYPLFVDGVEKDCRWDLFDPTDQKSQKMIRCNYARFVGDRAHPVSETVQFHDSVHELLGIAGLEPNNRSNSDYFYTDQLAENAQWVPHYQLVVKPSSTGAICYDESTANPHNIFSCPFTNSRKAEFIYAFLSDPSYASYRKSAGSSEIDDLLIGLNNFKDPRTIDFFVETLTRFPFDTVKYDFKKSFFTRLYDPSNPNIADAVLKQITSHSELAPYAKNLSADEFNGAIQNVLLGLKAGRLPLLDHITNLANQFNHHPNPECTFWRSSSVETISIAIHTLGYLHEVRAKAAIQNLIKFPCATLAFEAQVALQEMKVAEQAIMIKQGNPNAIEWGENFVKTHNGSYENDSIYIIDAFEWVIERFPALRHRIKLFAQEELDSGYHDASPNLVARLKKLSQ